MTDDHQHGIAATHKLVRLNQQFCLQRPGIPTPAAMKWCNWSQAPSASRWSLVVTADDGID